MTVKERYRLTLEWFAQSMPVAETELRYGSPFQLLVAVILSAQCTDKRVNMITPPLFEAYPTAEAMSQAGLDDIFGYIRSVSYPNNKAKALLGASKMIVEEFGGEVPSDIDGQCDACRRLEPSDDGRGHPRVPRQRAYRPDDKQQDSSCH